MNISIIIPTYNRFQELKECLNSICNQSILPDEIVIIDDGNLKEIPLNNKLKSLGINLIYRKKKQNEKKGAAISRNIGIDLATGDVIFFIDDDMILEEDYIKNIIDFYNNSKDPKLGGAGSIDMGMGRLNILKIVEFIYNVIFLISPIFPNRITISGYSESVVTWVVWRLYNKRKPIKVMFLGGGSCSFYKKVLEKYKFSEEYDRNLYMGEDKHFTLKISREFNLYLVPSARYINKKSPTMRPDKFKTGYNTILSAYRIYYNFVRKNRLHFVLFLYSTLGLLIKRLIIAFVKFNRDEFLRIKGMLKGVKDVIKYEFQNKASD